MPGLQQLQFIAIHLLGTSEKSKIVCHCQKIFFCFAWFRVVFCDDGRDADRRSQRSFLIRT
jgi:hypothetical protein